MQKLNKCPLCNSTDFKKLVDTLDFESKNSNIYTSSRCNSCGVAFLSTRLEEEKIEEAYDSSYQPHNTNYNLATRLFITLRTKWEIQNFKKLNPKTKNVLEIGCSFGEYIHRLNKLGKLNVTGIELNKNACKKGRKIFNLDIIEGKLCDINLKSNFFDLIIMNHLLEHTYNPEEHISKIKKLLTPNGTIMIKTPNFSLVERFVFGKFWSPYDAPRHIFVFNKKSMEYMLKKYNLKIHKISYESTPNNIILSIQNFLKYKKFPTVLINFFSINNLGALLLLTPFSLILGLLRISGRMVLVIRNDE